MIAVTPSVAGSTRTFVRTGYSTIPVAGPKDVVWRDRADYMVGTVPLPYGMGSTAAVIGAVGQIGLSAAQLWWNIDQMNRAAKQAEHDAERAAYAAQQAAAAEAERQRQAELAAAQVAQTQGAVVGGGTPQQAGLLSGLTGGGGGMALLLPLALLLLRR